MEHLLYELRHAYVQFLYFGTPFGHQSSKFELCSINTWIHNQFALLQQLDFFSNNLPLYSNPLHLLVHQLMFVNIRKQQPKLFPSSGILLQSKSRKSICSKLPSFGKDSQKNIVKVLRSILKEEKIWSADINLFTLLWFTNWPRLISLWNCFLSAKWIELATAFLLIQSNEWNTYWGLAANLSSQHFSLACTYFEGVNGISLSSIKWFLPLE